MVSVLGETCVGNQYVHLENIFKITGCKPFHLRDIVVKAADCESAKRRNLSEPVSSVSTHPRLFIIRTSHLTHLQEHLVGLMLHGGGESSA